MTDCPDGNAVDFLLDRHICPGRADADGLLMLRAVVVSQPHAGSINVTPLREELKNHAKEKVGPWKDPRWIEITDSLPKTAIGKIQRFRACNLPQACRSSIPAA